MRLGSVPRLVELATQGRAQAARYAAGALRNMQVRLQELTPDQLNELNSQHSAEQQPSSPEQACTVSFSTARLRDGVS